MAKELSTQPKWKPWKGILLFVIAFVWLFVGSFIGGFLGNFGVIFLQTGFLVIAIAAALINKTPLKEVFPIKKLTARDFFGTVLMWIGSMPIGLATALAIGQLLPEKFAQVSQSVASISSSALILGFIATVICPPICEEAIMRGAVLSNFRGVKKDWVIIIVIGILFGILHTDPIRFLNTTLMGAVMAYLVVKRNNILLASMYHFINNFALVGVSTIKSLFTGVNASAEAMKYSTEEISAATGSMLPTLMICGFLCPVILVIGAHLIKRQKEITEGVEESGMKLGKKILIALPFSAAMLIGGIVIFVQSGALDAAIELGKQAQAAAGFIF